MTVAAGPPLWKKVPTWYMVAEDDHMIVPATQRFMADRMKAKIKSHAVDHTPIVSDPATCCRHHPRRNPIGRRLVPRHSDFDLLNARSQ